MIKSKAASFHTAMIFALALCVSPGFAKNANDQESEEIFKEQAAARVVVVTGIVSSEGPAERPGFGPTIPSIEMATDESGSKATLTIGAGGARASDQSDDKGFYNITRQNFTFKAIVPVSKSDASSPFTFGGLGNFEKVQLGFASYHSRIGTAKGNESISDSVMDLATLACARIEANRFAQNQDGGLAVADKFMAHFQRMNNEPKMRRQDLLTDELAEEVAGELSAELKDIFGAVKASCRRVGGGNIAYIRKFVGSASADAYKATIFSKRPILFWGLNGEAGQNKMEFVDASAFIKKSDPKKAFSGSVFVGMIGADYKWSLRAKYNYVRQYEAAKEGQVCRPSTTVLGTQDCLSGALGAPKLAKTSVGSIEFRKRINLLGPENSFPIAIAPQFTYDFVKKDYGIDLPIYLSSNKSGKLNGGIRFGYRSDTKDLGAGLFLNTPFQLLF